MSASQSILTIQVILHVVVNFCACLKITRLNVPLNGYVGQSVWFNCSYDLEGDTLYSIKWYKDSEEFYRYIPSNSPDNVMTYDALGIKVNTKLTRGGNLNVIITHVNGSGEYRCEVSAEAPSFQTSRRSSILTVMHEASAAMDLHSKVNGKRNFTSHGSSSSSFDSKATDHNQNVQFSTSSINADNTIEGKNTFGFKSTSSHKRKYQPNQINDGDNQLTPNDEHHLNDGHLHHKSSNLFTQALPMSVACCWKVIAGMVTVFSVSIILFTCYKLCINVSCCFCWKNKRPPSPVPMTVSSITASHSLLESNPWEK